MQATATYEPFVNGCLVGYRVTLPNGHIRWVYFNPSGDTEGGPPNVFVYIGEQQQPDPGFDYPQTYIDIT